MKGRIHILVLVALLGGFSAFAQPGEASYRIWFAVSSFEVNPRFSNNRDAMDGIASLLQSLSDRGVDTVYVSLHSFCSPEGRADLNKALARNRGLNVQTWMQSLEGIPALSFRREVSMSTWTEAKGFSVSYFRRCVPTVTKTDQTHYNVKIRLLNNVTYHFAFFAQKKGTYAFSSDKKTIAIDYTGMSANSDASDAFFAHINGYTVSGSFTRSVTLSRPFAQINFGAVKADYQAAAASQVAFDETLNTAITVKQAPTVLNLLSGEVSAPTDVSFLPAVYMGNTAASANLTVTPEAFPGATPVRYMGMVYILADAETASTLSKVTMSISGLQNGSAFSSSRDVTNVPVRRNFRTQIVGNVFTDEGTFNITLVPVYDTPDNEENL